MYHWVYILRCSNDSLYTGSTSDPDKRYLQHCSGKGAKYTRAFAPVAMVGCWKIEGDRGMAMSIEASIKKLKRRQKELLVENPESITQAVELDPQIKITSR